ncbi:ATP-binding domain-containing protein [Rhodocyclus gracilis]|uniref:DNA 3'-5' helicase II n=1 Tax=Rhodocyclus tenuis TaxID=1066 RepID=A0A6L5K0I0_RHOTE|nr:ATP-binding domain-containing protein [Rhodocyclus gracilis]MQY52340.1 AAA family ATPase [Rhodocyclus gracilis]
MAKVFPDGWREMRATGAAERELQTLTLLAEGLDDRYAVFHGVHWTRVVPRQFTLYGEIDFAIVGPTGTVLLIEQKSGFLSETPNGLCKRYPSSEKNVAVQMARNTDALYARLHQFCGGEPPRIEALLYCPDYTVREPGSAGIDPARIVDARRRDELLPLIRQLLPASGEVQPLRPKVLRFLGDILELVPEVNAIVGEAESLYTRLSGGLAHWARQIDCTPFRLRVVASAGTGKTQLAMAVFREALAAGRRPLYVCYNRPLADHIAVIVPGGGEVATYHQLADRVSRTLGQPVDFSRPGAFARLEGLLDHFTPDATWQFDALIVDEGQDFAPAWAANLLRLLRPEGRAWWLEDPMQNLYGRPPVDLPGWVTLRARTNYRSPHRVVDLLNRLLALDPPAEAGSPIDGGEVDISTYADGDTADLVAKSTAAITRAIGAGFRRPHIALLTYRGREHSQLTPYEKLGPYPLRAPTGRYDLFGSQETTDGDVLIDSVHRFKGRAAPCVIFTEIDFATLDEKAVRRLFVGATRATMRLSLILSASAARTLFGSSDATHHVD